MNPKLQQAVLATAAAVAIGAPGFVAAGRVTSRLASVAPLKSVWVNQAERLAANVAEASKGDVKIEVFVNAQLGNEQDVLQQVIRGRIDMMLASNVGIASQEPAAMVTNMYFFFEDNERDCVLDEHMLKPMRELLAAKNLHVIGWYEVGSSGFAAKRKITSPADVKNVKVAYSPAKFATACLRIARATGWSEPASTAAARPMASGPDSSPIPSATIMIEYAAICGVALVAWV